MASANSTLRLHNTLTRQKEDFVPLDPANVRMYVCGPTVYDYAHIGNARPAIVFDVLFRLLRHSYGAEHVTYVRNITDVDDKINARAVRDYPGLPLNDAIRKVTETTGAQYLKDTAALGCLEPTVQPRATDNIEQMKAMIQVLLDRDHAYVAQGAEGRETLFDVHSMKEYGQLSQRVLADQEAGARVEVKDHKRNPADFVLWKESSSDQPGWDATFRMSEANARELRLNSTTVSIRGRPGWHIECSAMSERYLGKIFDIHAGGLDLIFPHHENELAQSRCAHDTPAMAEYWLHNGFLQIEGQKMSKSLGNFFTIHELLETEKFGGRRWPGEVLRLAMLMTHYREPIDFTVARLEEAERILKKWSNLRQDASEVDSRIAGNRMLDPQPNESFIKILSEDLDTGAAIRHLQSVAKIGEQGDAQALFDLINGVAFLGFELQDYVPQKFVDELVIIEARDRRLAALNAKDFATADAIRAELLAQGIQLMDGKNAAGERVTTWEIKR